MAVLFSTISVFSDDYESRYLQSDIEIPRTSTYPIPKALYLPKIFFSKVLVMKYTTTVIAKLR